MTGRSIGVSVLRVGYRAGLAVVMALAIVAVGSGNATAATATAATPAAAPAAGTVAVNVGAPLNVRPIPSGFIGLSLEYYEIRETLGATATTLNPVFAALVHKLAGSSAPNLRIGGASADWTWVRTPGVTPPAPVNFTLTPTLISVLAATARELNARYLLDLNLAADIPRLTGHEGWALYRGIGAHFIRAEEIGNEPELYATDEWSRPPEPLEFARTSAYDFSDYATEFDEMSAVLPPIATAGPATGDTDWATSLGAGATAANRLSTVTVHRYALPRCGLNPGDPGFPTVAKLLDPATATNLAASVVPVVDAAHADHLAARVDEVNSAPCFGVVGVSNTFASALWSLQTSFALAATGVDGVNFHTEPAAAHRLFNFYQVHGTWHGTVFPEFYGLMMFHWAAPPGSRLLNTQSTSGALSAWATQTRTARRVVLINTGAAQTVNLRVSGARGPAQLITLTDRSPYATSGETIGGVAFDHGTTTGQLSAAPHVLTVHALRSGGYRLRVAAHSAALLTLHP
jgi:hypothetical protein